MATKLIITASPGELRAARLDDHDRVQQFFLERTASPSRIGSIYLGRVRRAVPGLAGVFVDVGDVEIFVSVTELPPASIVSGARAAKNKTEAPVAEGGSVIVQITAAAVGDKLARGTGVIGIPLEASIYRPWTGGVAVMRGADAKRAEALRKALAPALKKGEGALVRAHAAAISQDVPTALEALRRDIESGRAAWQPLAALAARRTTPGLLRADLPFAPRLVRDAGGAFEIEVDDADIARHLRDADPVARVSVHREPVFEKFAIEEEWQSLLERRVTLPNGAALTIDGVEAATVIDVDAPGGAGEGSAAHRRTVNLAAAAEVARQLRLRDIGGQVLVDFLRLDSDADRQRVLKALIAATAADDRAVKIAGFTRLGLVELTRKREGPGIVDRLAVAERPTRGKSLETAAYELLRAVLAGDLMLPGRVRAVAVSASLAAVLGGAGLAAARKTTEQRLGRALDLRIEPARVSDDWQIVL